MAAKYILIFLNKYLRKNKLIPKLLFKTKVSGNERIYWDFTTIILKNILKQNVKEKNKILEIGTGPYAILSVYLKKKFKCDITACDINSDYVKSAFESAKKNKVNIDIVESNLFEKIKGKYDIIFFNSVYIPKEKGYFMGIQKYHKYETDWCGGDSGTVIIERFIKEAKNYLTESGKIFLGFNPYYLPLEDVSLICKKNDYKDITVFEKIFNPSVVYLLKFN